MAADGLTVLLTHLLNELNKSLSDKVAGFFGEIMSHILTTSNRLEIHTLLDPALPNPFYIPMHLPQATQTPHHQRRTLDLLPFFLLPLLISRLRINSRLVIRARPLDILALAVQRLIHTPRIIGLERLKPGLVAPRDPREAVSTPFLASIRLDHVGRDGRREEWPVEVGCARHGVGERLPLDQRGDYVEQEGPEEGVGVQGAC